MFWQSYKSAAVGGLGDDMHGLCSTYMHSLHTCHPQESGAKSPEPLTQPDKLYFDIYAQRTDALVIAAVQWQ